MPSENENGVPLHVHRAWARRESIQRQYAMSLVHRAAAYQRDERVALFGRTFQSLEFETWQYARLEEHFPLHEMTPHIQEALRLRLAVEERIRNIVWEFRLPRPQGKLMPDDFSKLDQEVQRRIRGQLDDGVISHDDMRELVRRTSGQDIGHGKPMPVAEEYGVAHEPHDYRDGGLVPVRPRTRWASFWARLWRVLRGG